jgi:medium-chain acyl-[acyl-carrier-protein] hydrolase
LAETPRTDLRELARELADDLQQAIDRAYVLLGYSLGGWLAFELARELRRRSARMPAQLIVAAAGPPDMAIGGPALHTLPDADFIAAIQKRYDAIPQAIINNSEILKVLLPVLRADIQMVETYRYAAEPPLDVEMLALGGTEDPAISPAMLAEWQRHTSDTCSVRLFPGRHFFLFHAEDVPAIYLAREPISAGLRTVIASLERMLSNV